MDGSVHIKNYHSGYNRRSVVIFAVRESETFRLISVELTQREDLSVDFGLHYGAGVIDTVNIRYKDVTGEV